MEEELIENMNLASGPEETETEPEPEPECKIDPEKLEKLMQLCKEQYPHIPEYFIYTYSVGHLMENNNEI